MFALTSRPPQRTRTGLSLSPNEERYVLSEAVATETFGNPWAVRIRGPLDERRLRAAIQATCDRHEGRRTGYEAGPDGRFTRFVEARGRPDVRSVSMVGASPAAVRALIREWFFERCDLQPPTLTKFLLIKLAADEHLLGNYLHHAVNDGETHQATMVEVIDRYAGREPDGPATQYSDLWPDDWRTTPAYLEAEGFWKGFLSGVETVGELPADGGDPPGGEVTGPARVRLTPEAVAAAREAAARAGVSEFAFYYAVALVLLTRLTGERRICSTFQSGGRRLVPGSAGVHGVFSNGLVLATEVDETGSIAALAGRLRGDIREALAHEAYPYHHIIQATGLRPRFGINWYPDVVFPACPDVVFEPPEMDFGAWEYDLNIRFFRHLASGGVDVIFYFREPAISRARAVAATEQFAALLAAFSRDVTQPVGATASRDLAPAGMLPDPDAPLPRGGGEPIQAAFLRQARERPDAPAVAHGPDTWTYAEVERRSHRVAARLQAAGVRPGDRVAIVAERSPELVWSVLGAARLGAVFAVLDSAHPQARLEALAAIAAPRLVLAAGSGVAALAGRLAEGCAAPWAAAEGDADPATAVAEAADPDAPAYILFTSGSTGQPKGVACSHRPLSRFVTWQTQAYGLGPGDRFSLLSGLAHDPLLRDLFTPLSIGACLAIPEAAVLQTPGALPRWMRAAKVSVAHMTPALGQLLTAGARRGGLPALRHLFWGGDLLPPGLVAEAAGLAPHARQTNFYGATETPQAVAAMACGGPGPRRAVPVGKGVNGAQLTVLDAAGRPLGIGEVGEIAVRSNHLSLGYVEAGRIVAADDRGPDGATYRTGDRGLHLPGGDVLLLGRADDQVKVRGHRVELAEIAAALRSQPGVREAVALAIGQGDRLRIAVFATVRRRDPPSGTDLLAGLAARLPAYMLPTRVDVLARLPLLANGKPDRDALRAMAEPPPESVTPRDLSGANATERALIAAWSDVLGEGAPISRNSSFAALGGDSLSYVQAYLATETVLGVTPSGWQVMSVSELAAQKRATHGGWWSTVDTPMLVRALAITAIVAGHMAVIRYGGGATSGLMLVSGFLLGGLQLRQAFEAGSAQPIREALQRLLAPTLVFSLALYVAKSLAGLQPDLSVLFLYGNFQDYSRLSGPHWGGHEFYLWFIDCMLQMLGLTYLTALALRGGARVGRTGFMLGLFAVGCLGRFVLPAVFVPGFITLGAPPLTALNLLPTTHLSTLMLGGLLAAAATRRARVGVLILLGAYAGLSGWFYGPNTGLVIGAAGLLLFAVPRVRLPRILTRLVLTLSGASLFIYLAQFLFRSALHLAGAPDWPLLHLAAALAGGVAVWSAWTWGVTALSRHLRRETPDAATVAI